MVVLTVFVSAANSTPLEAAVIESGGGKEAPCRFGDSEEDGCGMHRRGSGWPGATGRSQQKFPPRSRAPNEAGAGSTDVSQGHHHKVGFTLRVHLVTTESPCCPFLLS